MKKATLVGSLSLVILFVLAWVSSCAPGESGQIKNVLLLIADDQGLEMGCYGNTVIQTPNQDRLAQQGVKFTHAFAAVSSCSSSRSVMLTGLFNHTNGQYGLAHNYHNFHALPKIESLPALLKKSGYRTGIIGKFHVKPESQYPFDYYASSGKLGGGRDVSAMAEKAAEFFTQAAETPFFLLVGFVDPHRGPRNRFANEDNYPGVQPIRYSPAEIPLPAHIPDTPEAREDMAEYYQAVSRLDQGIGLVLDRLKSAGRDRDTLVIFLSDNGIPFPGAKTTLYDAGVRLPLIISSPAQSRRGLTNHAMVSWVDLVPTILDWTDVEGPSYPLPGRSMLPVLEQENPEGWDEVFLSHTFHEVTMYYPSRGVRTRRYKYLKNLYPALSYPYASDLWTSATWQSVLNRNLTHLGLRPVQAFLHRPAEELYELRNDPHEVKNLAGDPDYLTVLKDLRARVRAFQKKTGDPWGPTMAEIAKQNYGFTPAPGGRQKP